jgi:hypothetical protein
MTDTICIARDVDADGWVRKYQDTWNMVMALSEHCNNDLIRIYESLQLLVAST